MDLIKREYVDKENEDSLGDIAIQAMLAKLDPHSVYLPAQELEQLMKIWKDSFME